MKMVGVSADEEYSRIVGDMEGQYVTSINKVSTLTE